MPSLLRLCAAALALAFTPAPVLGAAGPFEASRLEPVGAPPREGETLAYRLTLAAEPSADGLVEIRIPSATMFVRVEGLPGAEFDHDGRTLRWHGTVGSGAAREVMVTLVAGIDAGGETSSLHVTLRPWQGEPTFLEHSAEVDTRPAPSAVRLGGVGVTAAGVAVIAWLGSAGLFWLVLRVVRPRAATWAPVVIMLPLGFLLYFAALARDDLRILALPQTTCTVVDRVLDSRTASSSSSGSRRSGPQTVYAPRLALQYQHGAEARVTQGFSTDSRLSGASAAGAQGVLARYAIGARVPCAVDARDPRRAYVERGFGGAYFFALIPLPVLVLGVWGLQRGW